MVNSQRLEQGELHDILVEVRCGQGGHNGEIFGLTMFPLWVPMI